MLFTTDQQTIDDLNIFGGYSTASVYAMFNRTFTRGGASLLEEMFRFPLSNATDINKRSSTIKYFAGHTQFPFDTELFDIVEQYLGNTDERTQLSQENNTLFKKLNKLIAEDSDYKFVNIGVKSTIAIINSVREFAQTIVSDSSIANKDDVQDIIKLLSDPFFETLPTKKKELSYTKIAELDVALRFKRRNAIKKLLRHIYYLDVYISVSKIALERGFVFPTGLEGKECNLKIKGFYHPQLPGAIPNDIVITPQNGVVFLTGANMAGKSTFMKSIGIAMYLAHMGFPVAAKEMEFVVMDGIYTTINLPDNLGKGTSHFYAEVLRVKKVAKELALKKNLFVIVDELFRGTNVKDAYEATLAVTTGFAKRQHSIFIISTHIVETAEVLKATVDNICFKYMPTLMEYGQPVYTYILKEGVTNDRHGMIIINKEGIIDLLLKRKPTVS